MGRTFLGIYSLLFSCLLLHFLITAGWCGLSPAYLMYHTFSCSESVRYVHSSPQIPQHSPASPLPFLSGFSTRWKNRLRYVSTFLLPSLPSCSHYSLESTSLATAALNILDDDDVSGSGSGPGSLSLPLLLSRCSRSADNEINEIISTHLVHLCVQVIILVYCSSPPDRSMTLPRLLQP
jgi:hypothetical protein